MKGILNIAQLGEHSLLRGDVGLETYYYNILFFTLFTALYMKGRYIIMNKFVKHSITQTKDYACSSEYAKNIAKNVVGSSVGLLVAVFLKNVLMNYLNDED